MKTKAICLALFLVFAGIRFVFAQDHQSNLQWLRNEKEALDNITLLNHETNIIPLTSLEKLNAASINLGNRYDKQFNAVLNRYTKVDTVIIHAGTASIDYNQLNDALKLYHTVIFQIGEKTVLEPALLNFLLEMETSKTVIIVVSGQNDHSGFFKTLHVPVLWSKQHTAESASVLAQIIFGGIGLGKQPALRISYTVPEAVGVNQSDLDSIDLVMKQGITAKAFPGGVVMVLKNGKVIFEKAYGKQTYTGSREMKTTDIFDMASLTKTSATTLAVMKMVEQGRLGLDSPISNYIARTREMPNKKDIKIREVMLHQAGFFPFIPFYEKLKPADMSTVQSADFPTEVADGYFLRANYYKEIMWPQMLNDKILTRGKYVYSDLSMYYMREIVEKVSGEKMNEYLDQQFYFPLGMQTGGFLPRTRFAKDQIVPTTENDGWFRKMRVQGFVNDPGAAMAGGVSGHAGFFASANDAAILYQMLLNKGSYGGHQYFQPATVNLFTSSQSAVSRRGLGFDRKDPDPAKAYPSALASSSSYGHTGYTGTLVWVDPADQLVYILLTNRVYPDDKSKVLGQLNIRGKIQDIIYRAIRTDSANPKSVSPL